MSTTRPYDLVKRLLDVVLASIGLLVLAPFQGVLALLIARRLGRPVLFAQKRPGRGGRVFTLYKFRTMLPVDEARGLVTDADRMMGFGQTLRSTSLDELPTLWNVVKGDMSLVGPRPLLVSYLSRYSAEQARRHEVRPGITGWAQVNGRNAISWEEKFRLDVEYVERRSFRLDVQILVKTVTNVLRRDGISADGEVTMSEFTGSSQPPSSGER